jgi:hypothetical protein
LRRKIVKKLFLVFLVMLVGMAGLSAAPPGEGWADDAPQVVVPQADSTASIRAPGMPLLPGGGFDMAQAVELICQRSDQYRQGLLTQDEFKVLVADRVTVMYMKNQAGIGGMKPLAEKTKQKADRFFMYRELRLGIHRPASLVPGAGNILEDL